MAQYSHINASKWRTPYQGLYNQEQSRSLVVDLLSVDKNVHLSRDGGVNPDGRLYCAQQLHPKRKQTAHIEIISFFLNSRIGFAFLSVMSAGIYAFKPKILFYKFTFISWAHIMHYLLTPIP